MLTALLNDCLYCNVCKYDLSESIGMDGELQVVWRNSFIADVVYIMLITVTVQYLSSSFKCRSSWHFVMCHFVLFIVITLSFLSFFHDSCKPHLSHVSSLLTAVLSPRFIACEFSLLLYYYMYLITLHKSLQETNRGSGDSHVISSWKPVRKNVSLSQIGIVRM